MPGVKGRVADAFEARVREHEEGWLSPLAVRSYETRGRAREEAECRVRTPFQRDRDRILHSKAFRRLKGKTQVFIDPAGDHFRTRMTHTLETTAIARGVARALQLNEDLTEAIGLGHDMGHTPFGHVGEEALDALPARALRAGLPPQRAVAPDRRDAEPDVGGARRHPQAHGRGRAGHARGQDRAHRRPRRVHQPRHRRRDPPWDSGRGRPAGRRGRAARPERVEANRRARPRPRRVVGSRGRHRPERGRGRRRCSRSGGSCSSASTSARTRAEEHTRARETVRRIFGQLADRGDSPAEIVDYLSGMTDRFALQYAAAL